MTFPENTMPSAAAQEQEVSGWAVGFTVFAAIIMIMGGIFQFIVGLGAVIQANFYQLSRAYAFDMSVTTWGWVHMIAGIIVGLAGCYLFTGNLMARIIAVGIAMLAIVINFFFIPYYPIWSLLIIGVMIGTIWALIAHGRDIAMQE